MLAFKLVWCILFSEIFMSMVFRQSFNYVEAASKTIEEIFQDYEDEKNAVLSISPKEKVDSYDDFYEELDNWMQVSSSMNIIFFGPASSFMRLDVESILHVLSNTKKHLIPISKVLLAWDLVTDGKTAAFLQGREFYAFGSLLNVVPEEDLYYVNFGDPSVLKFFSQHTLQLHTRKYGILVASYKRFYGNEWFRNGSYINDLGYLLCGFPATDLKSITPEVFKEINVETFSKLHRCNMDQMETLYKIAVHREAYGSPYDWSSHEVENMGKLLAYIPANEICSIQLEAIPAITPKVMRLISQNKLEYFTLQQIHRMNPPARRVFVLRMQLRNSLDMNLMKRQSANMYGPSILLSTVSLVTVELLVYS